MPNAEQMAAIIHLDLAIQKVKDEFFRAGEAEKALRQKNDVLAGERDELRMKVRDLEIKLAESISIGRRAQEELKHSIEKIEEYEKLLHKT
jgi:hypothetical protein